MDARATVEAYYDALRNGDPLGPYFATGAAVVKFSLSERLSGGDAVTEGLREQTRTTTDWSVESHRLMVTERDRHAWFTDDVSMAWTDTDRQIRYEFETRWSGSLELTDGQWQFVGMHVSAPTEL